MEASENKLSFKDIVVEKNLDTQDLTQEVVEEASVSAIIENDGYQIQSEEKSQPNNVDILKEHFESKLPINWCATPTEVNWKDYEVQNVLIALSNTWRTDQYYNAIDIINKSQSANLSLYCNYFISLPQWQFNFYDLLLHYNLKIETNTLGYCNTNETLDIIAKFIVTRNILIDGATGAAALLNDFQKDLVSREEFKQICVAVDKLIMTPELERNCNIQEAIASMEKKQEEENIRWRLAEEPLEDVQEAVDGIQKLNFNKLASGYGELQSETKYDDAYDFFESILKKAAGKFIQPVKLNADEEGWAREPDNYWWNEMALPVIASKRVDSIVGKQQLNSMFTPLPLSDIPNKLPKILMDPKSPPSNISISKDGTLTIEVALQGYNSSNSKIEVYVEEDYLYINAKLEMTDERSYLQRGLKFMDSASLKFFIYDIIWNAADIVAHLQDGVLTITCPPKKIRTEISVS